ncbi:hypothetical protein LEP1GSC061_0602 [Leptospira wolffii serovar Khorat str. Khorat-H2]|nr:hypothetical protein LEP1GSC061_0602 [Leptospira wolffii serovar Khorat str. Khorat-H2]
MYNIVQVPCQVSISGFIFWAKNPKKSDLNEIHFHMEKNSTGARSGLWGAS